MYIYIHSFHTNILPAIGKVSQGVKWGLLGAGFSGLPSFLLCYFYIEQLKIDVHSAVSDLSLKIRSLYVFCLLLC